MYMNLFIRNDSRMSSHLFFHMQTGGLKTNIVSMSIIIIIVICTLFHIQCLEALLHRIFHNCIMINNDVR